MGYRHVLDYAGGKADWIQAGLPLEKSELQPAEPPKRP